MNKLTALIEAAKADCIAREGNYGELCGYGDDILELCALLEKAEWTLEAMVENCEEPPEANCSCHVAPPCNDCVDFSGLREVFSDSKETLAAIKQWKEQT